MRFFDSIEVGEVNELGEYQVTKEDIIEFGEKYDPQPFHTDEQAAEDSMFGGLVASGWHTAAICMRLLVDGTDDMAAQAGIGIDNLRWHRPLRPGDTLRLRNEIIEKRLSESQDDRGYVTTRHEGWNQNDKLVIAYEGTAIVRRREE